MPVTAEVVVTLGERALSVRGRGTRVLVRDGGTFRIVHEHLSRFPGPPWREPARIPAGAAAPSAVAPRR